MASTPERATADEELLPEFRNAPDGLGEPDVAALRSFFGEDFVDSWIASAKERGLIVNHHGAASPRRTKLTAAGERLCRDMFPGYTEVALPPR